TSRQLVALTAWSDLASEAREHLRRDAVAAGVTDDEKGLDAGGKGATAYAEAVSIYLAFVADKAAEYGCTLVPWYSKEDRPKGLFARQAIPMVWDFAEVNPFTEIGGTFDASVEIVAGALSGCSPEGTGGFARQADAATHTSTDRLRFISTDPPYYDNV